MKIAVVGCTGMVGKVMLQVLAERNIEITDLIPIASSKSVGKQVMYKDKPYTIVSMESGVEMKPDIAIFSAGGSVSLEWAPKFAAVGTTVIDNSSAWRMDPTKKLIVPEINASELGPEDKIIANPNCSTIQMVMVLAPIHHQYGLKRLVISTYQSITGTGVSAMDQYKSELNGVDNPAKNPYPHPIFENCLPHCDIFYENGYTKEELKLVNETHKILGDPSIGITATAVRVPVMGGHSEAVNLELKQPFEISTVKRLLQETEGVMVMDDIDKNIYPMPLHAHGKDEVFVGRIRRDDSIENGLNLWIVADNLRKGAATNAVQIAQYLIKQGMIEKKVMI